MTQSITDALLKYGETIPREGLTTALTPAASRFVVSGPYPFILACCLDRGMKAEIVWTFPYYLFQQFGHLDPFRISQMDDAQLAISVNAMPHRPRYVNAAPRTIRELTHIVVDECQGDAARLWSGKTAAQVKQTLQRIYGVGPQIANMTILLIEGAFPVRFDDLDRSTMDVKADVHVMRVLYRLGVAGERSEAAAIAAARRLSPAFPGAIDGALWNIGRIWCSETRPNCRACPVTSVCQRRGV